MIYDSDVHDAGVVDPQHIHRLHVLAQQAVLVHSHHRVLQAVYATLIHTTTTKNDRLGIQYTSSR